MKARIALGGSIPDDSRIFGKVDLIIEEIKERLSEKQADVEIQLIVSPAYTGEAWHKWNEAHGFSICACNMKEEEGREQAEYTRTIDTPIKSIISAAMCSEADILLAVWNEDTAELSGASWELIQMAYDKKVPCIWISSKTQKIYCLWESYYKSYSPQYLKEALDPLPDRELTPEQSDARETPLLSFWEKRRRNYLKKHKAENGIHQSVRDSLLDADFKIEDEAAQGEPVRQLLLKKFHEFDEAAIKLNSKFQAMLYQRSILPFITTVFLAVGFYAETLIGKTTAAAFPSIESAAVWLGTVLAGVGFLIHAFLNLYVYRLSKSQRISKWQSDFVSNRFIAELLRVLIHFTPYGISLDMRKLCEGKKEIYAQLKHIADGVEPYKQNYDQKSSHYVMKHIKEMLQDQLAYHEASLNRYKSLVNSLDSWGKIVLYIGFFTVLGRGALQFVLSIFPVEAVNGVDVNGILRSFLNMLALLLPAWAGYFSAKAQQNNFRYNYNNHRRMLERLTKMHGRVDFLLEQEEIPIELSEKIAEELAEIMLKEDTNEWTYQYMNSTIKPL